VQGDFHAGVYVGRVVGRVDRGDFGRDK